MWRKAAGACLEGRTPRMKYSGQTDLFLYSGNFKRSAIAGTSVALCVDMRHNTVQSGGNVHLLRKKFTDVSPNCH